MFVNRNCRKSVEKLMEIKLNKIKVIFTDIVKSPGVILDGNSQGASLFWSQ